MHLDFQPKSESLIRSSSKDIEQKNIARRRNAAEENQEEISRRRAMHTQDAVSCRKDVIATDANRDVPDKKITHHLDSINNHRRIDLYG